MRSIYRRSPHLNHSFHWLEAGWQNKETVVLLHGLMAHSMAFRSVIQALSLDYRVIVPDLPAHGRDETFRSSGVSPDVGSLVTWLEALLATISDEQVHLVGHSLGATMAFLSARDCQEVGQLASLTLVSPGLQIAVPRWASSVVKRIPVNIARLGATRMGIRLYEPVQWRRVRMNSLELNSYLAPIRDVERLKFMMELGVDLIAHPDRLVGAEGIHLPTLIMWGDKDHLLPVSTAYALKEQVGGAQLRIFGDCGHCPMEDYPIDFVQAIQDFVK